MAFSPWSSLTIPIPQSLVDKVVAAPVLQVAGLSGPAGRRHSCRDTEAHPHGLSDHRDSPVARGHVVDAPGFAGRASRALREQGCSHARCVQRQVVDILFVTQRRFPMVPAVLRTMGIPQSQFIGKVFDVPVCGFLGCRL